LGAIARKSSASYAAWAVRFTGPGAESGRKGWEMLYR
jgi:hypothetical protein